MPPPSEQEILEAVSRLALDEDDLHRPVPMNRIPDELFPPRAPDDLETRIVVSRLCEQGRLEVHDLGTVALPRPLESDEST